MTASAKPRGQKYYTKLDLYDFSDKSNLPRFLRRRTWRGNFAFVKNLADPSCSIIIISLQLTFLSKSKGKILEKLRSDDFYNNSKFPRFSPEARMLHQ